MNTHYTRNSNGSISQWAVVKDNEVYWYVSFEEAEKYCGESNIYGIQQMFVEDSPVDVMFDEDSIRLSDVTPTQAVLLMHNLTCDKETARE